MKKSLITLIAAGALCTSAIFTQNVDAATMRVSHNAYIYNAKAKRVGRRVLRKGRVVKTSGLKKIKGKYYWRVGRNQYVKKGNIAKKSSVITNTYTDNNVTKATKHQKDSEIYKPVATKSTDINIDNNPTVPSAKSAIANADSLPAGTKFSWDSSEPLELKAGGNNVNTVIVTYPDGSKDTVDVQYTYHGTNHIVLPKDYTLAGLKQSDTNPTSQMVSATDEGNRINNFISESVQDDKEKVNMLKLTADQKQEISEFALKMINEARSQLGQSAWHYDTNVQSLADDIAAKYQKDGRGIQDGDHYVSGIVAVAAKHGYDLEGLNQLEDMYGSTEDAPKTMTDLKKMAYDGVVSFLFNPSEFHHAADIMSGHTDGRWNSNLQNRPFAISFSRVDGWNSVHYIRIPSNVER